MKYWVHIGIHKTGSTFLQNVLAANREWLIEQGFMFPETGFVQTEGTGGSRGHAGLVRAFRNPDSEDAKHIMGKLKDETAWQGKSNVLLSSEVFSAPQNTESCARGIRELVGGGETIHVIVYLRRQDYWLDSFYREILGWKSYREKRDIEQFFEEEKSHWLDYNSRLRPWLENFGKSGVTIRSYDDAVAGPGLFRDFASCIGISGLPPRCDNEEIVNQSLPRCLADLLRAINTLPNISNSHKAQITRCLEEVKFSNDMKKGSLVDDKLWGKIANEFDVFNQTLTEEAMSGPSDRFRFQGQRECTHKAQQTIRFDDALELFNAVRGELPE